MSWSAAVQEALLSAAKKAVGPARELRVAIDPKNGDIRAFAKLVVSEKVISKHDQISVFDARRIKPDAQVGEEVEVEVTPVGFGRIAAQYAKQALMQHIRRAEKQLIFTEFKDRVGDIISGTVRRFDRSDVIVDLGKYEALLPNRERVPTEEYQVGERIRCYVKAVEQGPHGPEIILSRADPRFVIKLFQLEVSEINDGTIEIKGIAREPGFRTKLAVWTRDEKVDPVGACVGLRGQRVKNIVRELNNEKVDIIRWDPNIRNFITNALAPAKLKAFEIDEASKRVKIIVSEDQLSLAIGKRGQNARLTSKLTGWQVDIEAGSGGDQGLRRKSGRSGGVAGGHSGNYPRAGRCAGASWLDASGRFAAGGCERSGRNPADWRAGGGDSGSRARRSGAAHVESRRSAGLRLNHVCRWQNRCCSVRIEAYEGCAASKAR